MRGTRQLELVIAPGVVAAAVPAGSPLRAAARRRIGGGQRTTRAAQSTPPSARGAGCRRCVAACSSPRSDTPSARPRAVRSASSTSVCRPIIFTCWSRRTTRRGSCAECRDSPFAPQNVGILGRPHARYPSISVVTRRRRIPDGLDQRVANRFRKLRARLPRSTTTARRTIRRSFANVSILDASATGTQRTSSSSSSRSATRPPVRRIR